MDEKINIRVILVFLKKSLLKIHELTYIHNVRHDFYNVRLSPIGTDGIIDNVDCFN